MKPVRLPSIFPIEDLRTDDNAQTNIIQLYFEDVMSEEELPLLKRANAMSVSYELLDHEMIRPGGVDNPENDYEFAVMMYEVMLPILSGINFCFVDI